MDEAEIRGRWALVTGASSGLGVDFARELARRGCHLILVARRRELLEKVAAEIGGGHGVEVVVLPMDLGDREAPVALYQEVKDRGLEVSVLVNNAGFGIHGRFLKIPWERERAMLDLDIVSLVHLTKVFAPDMVGRGFGRILQIGSVGAYQAVPTYASYAAAKAFVLLFGEALNHELAGTGVTSTVLSPGVTATEFLEVAGQSPTLYQRLFMMKSSKVAGIGVRAMLQGKSSKIPGLLNFMMAWSIRLIPRKLATAIGYRLMK